MSQKRRLLYRTLSFSGATLAFLVMIGATPAAACDMVEAEGKKAKATEALLSVDSQDLATLKKLDELGVQLETISASHDAAIENNDPDALDKACKDYDDLSQEVVAIKG